MEQQNDIESASAGTAGQPGPTRTSLAFRLTWSVAIGLLILMWSAIRDGTGIGTASSWTLASLASAGTFMFADLLLPMLVVAIPPGLLILAVIGLKSS